MTDATAELTKDQKKAKAKASFAAFFDASPTSEPRDPVATDVPPLSLTTEPIEN